jgi:hypothetical protein
MVHYIENNNVLLGIIIKNNYTLEESGINFFTNDDATQQVGYMKREAGHKIIPHRHNEVKREIYFTSEVLYIKTGIVRVDFYDEFEAYLSSFMLYEKDIVLLARGGHGFEIIETAEIIEVKQGPYVHENDKVRFTEVSNEQIKLINI